MNPPPTTTYIPGTDPPVTTVAPVPTLPPLPEYSDVGVGICLGSSTSMAPNLSNDQETREDCQRYCSARGDCIGYSFYDTAYNRCALWMDQDLDDIIPIQGWALPYQGYGWIVGSDIVGASGDANWSCWRRSKKKNLYRTKLNLFRGLKF